MGEGPDPEVASDREAIAGVGDERTGKLDSHVLVRTVRAVRRRVPPEPEVGGPHPCLAQEGQAALGARRVSQQVQADLVFVPERIVEPTLLVLLLTCVRP